MPKKKRRRTGAASRPSRAASTCCAGSRTRRKAASAGREPFTAPTGRGRRRAGPHTRQGRRRRARANHRPGLRDVVASARRAQCLAEGGLPRIVQAVRDGLAKHRRAQVVAARPSTAYAPPPCRSGCPACRKATRRRPLTVLKQVVDFAVQYEVAREQVPHPLRHADRWRQERAPAAVRPRARPRRARGIARIAHRAGVHARLLRVVPHGRIARRPRGRDAVRRRAGVPMAMVPIYADAWSAKGARPREPEEQKERPHGLHPRRVC